MSIEAGLDLATTCSIWINDSFHLSLLFLSSIGEETDMSAAIFWNALHDWAICDRGIAQEWS